MKDIDRGAASAQIHAGIIHALIDGDSILTVDGAGKDKRYGVYSGSARVAASVSTVKAIFSNFCSLQLSAKNSIAMGI